MSPQNSYVEALTPEPKNVAIFGEGAFKMLTKLKGNCWVGPNPIGLLFEGERYQGRVRTEERPYEDVARRRWSASQGERP